MTLRRSTSEIHLWSSFIEKYFFNRKKAQTNIIARAFLGEEETVQ